MISKTGSRCRVKHERALEVCIDFVKAVEWWKATGNGAAILPAVLISTESACTMSYDSHGLAFFRKRDDSK